jgi:haloalkane dehalogenase
VPFVAAFVRPLDSNFDALSDWPYAPRDHAWADLRMRYVDEGPSDAPVMLLLHGMPTWGYLYRTMIPVFLEAGSRCVAPDHFGFGRSDKPTDPSWYSIARHTEVLSTLVRALDLRDVTLVCQDWGGPIGLAQVAEAPQRFARLVLMNTWLHHPEYEYSDGMRAWIAMWQVDGVFDRERPDVACVPLFSGELAPMATLLDAIVEAAEPTLDAAAAANYAGWASPFRGLGDEAFHGARAFPLSIPLVDPDRVNAAAQSAHYRALLELRMPSHFIWGGADPVFTPDWGRTWAARMGATFDLLPDANHFLQNTHGEAVAGIVLGRIAEES